MMRNVIRWVLSVLVVAGVFAGASAASAQSSVEAAQGQDFLGTWGMTLETPDGATPMVVHIADVDGKVAVLLGGPQGQSTNVTKTGEKLVARSQISYQGMDLPMVITFTRDGANLKADWDFAEGMYTTASVATKQ